MNEQMRQMVASKQAERERLARLPFAEKLVLLGRLRERTLAMKGGKRSSSVKTVICWRVWPSGVPRMSWVRIWIWPPGGGDVSAGVPAGGPAPSARRMTMVSVRRCPV